MAQQGAGLTLAHIGQIAVPVKDPLRAVGFYRDTLDFLQLQRRAAHAGTF